MNLSFNAEDDKKYEESLNNAGNFVSDKDLPYVDSGLYQCEVSSAFPSQATINGVVEERINVTFIAYDKDGVTPVGKFTNNFTCDQSNKFFTKTFELCVLTGNDKDGVTPVGKFTNNFTCDKNNKFFFHTFELCMLTNNKALKEEPLLNKDGEQVISQRDNMPVMHYPSLKGTKLIASVFRKPDYVSQNGNTYANYTIYGLYSSDKRTFGEIRRNKPAESIKKDYAFLQKKIKEQAEQQEALNRTSHYTPPKPTPAPAYGNTPKPAMKEPTYASQQQEDEDLPF